MNIVYKDSLVLTDTLAINDIQDIDESEIELIEIKSTITNQLPLNAYVKIRLEDSNHQLIANLVPAEKVNIISAATINADGTLATAQTKEDAIAINADQFNKIFNSEYLILRAVLKTNTNGLVNLKFKSDLTLQANFGIRVKLKVAADL